MATITSVRDTAVLEQQYADTAAVQEAGGDWATAAKSWRGAENLALIGAAESQKLSAADQAALAASAQNLTPGAFAARASAHAQRAMVAEQNVAGVGPVAGRAAADALPWVVAGAAVAAATWLFFGKRR